MARTLEYLDHKPLPDSLRDSNETDTIKGFNAVQRDSNSWAASLPANQGLYLNEQEKDSCGVGFICHIKGNTSHKIVSDARQLLCAMTHRGATGADSRDGDGAGVMTAIPHLLFKRETELDLSLALPGVGEYAVGNIFFKAGDPFLIQTCQDVFSKIAKDLGLRVLGWRPVPTDGSILGPAASSNEPAIFQPFVVLQSHYGDGNTSQGGLFDAKYFECQLYVLRKHATHSMFVDSVLSLYAITAYYHVVPFLCYIKCARERILYMFLVLQEHCVQRAAVSAASIQLLP
jgi:glutamate synthase (NADPH/NADH)